MAPLAALLSRFLKGRPTPDVSREMMFKVGTYIREIARYGPFLRPPPSGDALPDDALSILRAYHEWVQGELRGEIVFLPDPKRPPGSHPLLRLIAQLDHHDSDLQRRILEALKGKSLMKDALRLAVGLRLDSDIYRRKHGTGLARLLDLGEVVSVPGGGYIRPEFPPPKP